MLTPESRQYISASAEATIELSKSVESGNVSYPRKYSIIYDSTINTCFAVTRGVGSGAAGEAMALPLFRLTS